MRSLESLQDESSFTRPQQAAITIAPAVSSFLSILGSVTILRMISTDWKRKIRKVKYRILMALSLSDIVNSSVFFVWSLPIPKDTPGVWGAIGNKATCDAQGFLMQVGILGSFFNAALSGFFMLTVCDGMSEKAIMWKYEIPTYVVAIGWSVGTAVIALFLDVYSFSGVGCYMAPEPLRCTKRDDVECVRGERAYLWVWLFTGIPLLLLLLYIMYTMGRIYFTVKEISEKADKITFDASNERFAAAPSGPTDLHSSEQLNSATLPQQPRSRYAARVKETAVQAALYVIAYLITHIWAFVCNIVEQLGGTNPFFLVFIENFCWPLQGFLNVFVYLRPSIQSIRKSDPDIPYYKAAYHAAFEDDRLHSKNNGRARTSGRKFKISESSLRHTEARCSNVFAMKTCDGEDSSKTNQEDGMFLEEAQDQSKQEATVQSAPTLKITVDS